MFILAILFDEINIKVKMLNVKFRIVFTKRLMSGILCHLSYPLDISSLLNMQILCSEIAIHLICMDINAAGQ